MFRFRPLAPVVILLLGLFPACTGKSPSGGNVLRVAYFPNITHSQALLGVARGDFQKALGKKVRLETSVMNAGPSVIEALFARRIDMAYIGPNPAINGFLQSEGKALRIVAGATSGGASFVVRADAGIDSLADLRGKRLATPQLGNTQDVALRAYLRQHGFTAAEMGGSVEVIPTPNPQILDLFLQGQIDGAWIPEPWASRLVLEGQGKVFVDERDLWPGGDFVSAQVIVAAEYLHAYPDVVKQFLAAHVAVTQWELNHPDEALPLLNEQIEKLTGKKLSTEVLTRAWSCMRPTWDPISSSLQHSANAAHAEGFLPMPANLEGIYVLELINEVLGEKGLPPVE